MKLKLVGVLQDFGTPYASLYRDGNDNNLYISILQNSIGKGMFCCLLFGVTPSALNSYFNQSIGLRDMCRASNTRYIWNFEKGSSGNITSLDDEDFCDKIIEDDIYDSFYCKQESAIKYRLSK